MINLTRNIYLYIVLVKGGFSLDISSSMEQIEAFNYLINTLVMIYSDSMSFYFISSLGCHCSQIDTPYKKLILANENSYLEIKNMFIFRLPSIWGFKKNPLRPIRFPIENSSFLLKTLKKQIYMENLIL